MSLPIYAYFGYEQQQQNLVQIFEPLFKKKQDQEWSKRPTETLIQSDDAFVHRGRFVIAYITKDTTNKHNVI